MRIVCLSVTLCVLTGFFFTDAFADDPVGDRMVLEGVTFDRESSLLKKAVIPSLQPLLRQMQQDPSLRITIESHVDPTGDPEKDLRLTLNRSRTISNWFVAQGVEAGRISPVGYGSARPFDGKAIEGGETANTRIEIVKTREGYPVAEFPSTRYQFEPVVDGTEVRHEYVIRNTGTAELLIKEVKTG